MCEKEPLQAAILVAVDTGEYDAESSLSELAELTKTAGGTVVAQMVQKRESPDAATCMGSGRLRELAENCEVLEAQLVIFDRELTAIQQRNLEDALPCRVVDRTRLILDIFARRARSAEGRLQVELALLQYRLPRLAGRGKELSRLGGGIGTRGPGESALETDKRHIRRRIAALKRQLGEVEKRRRLRQERRSKNAVPTVAIVGYTNAGKSTLMNALTNAGVLAEDKLFATLDTTVRALRLPDGQQALLIDTVGLLRRLPHHLVDAFRSTLEEAAEADVLIHLCDASNPEREEHLAVTRELLHELGCADRPVLTVMNKWDLCPQQTPEKGVIAISAATGEGLPALLEAIAAALPLRRRKVDILLPFQEGALAQACRQEGAVHKEQYTPQGVQMTVTLGMDMLERVRPYLLSQMVEEEPL